MTLTKQAVQSSKSRRFHKQLQAFIAYYVEEKGVSLRGIAIATGYSVDTIKNIRQGRSGRAKHYYRFLACYPELKTIFNEQGERIELSELELAKQALKTKNKPQLVAALRIILPTLEDTATDLEELLILNQVREYLEKHNSKT